MDPEQEVEASVDTGAEQPTEAAPQSAAPTSAPQQQPQQPQHDWEGLGGRHGGYDQVQQRLQYFDELSQRYQQDPAWAQQYDKLYGGQQQQAQHPLSWAKYDDAKSKAIRDAAANNPNDPDFVKHSGLMNDFYFNPFGTLGQMATHPDVMGPLYQSMQPQIQDLVNRAMQPMQQYMNHQGENQFRQQYEKAYLSLPDNVKQAHQKGRFGQGNQGIINAIDFANENAPPPAAGMDAGAQTPKPSNVNKNNAINKTSSAKPKDDADDDEAELDRAAKALHAARNPKK